MLLEVWVQIGQLALDGFDFCPGRNQRQVEEANAYGYCVEYVKLVQVVDVVSGQVEEDLVPD